MGAEVSALVVEELVFQRRDTPLGVDGGEVGAVGGDRGKSPYYSGCYVCGNKNHQAKNCDQIRSAAVRERVGRMLNRVRTGNVRFRAAGRGGSSRGNRRGFSGTRGKLPSNREREAARRFVNALHAEQTPEGTGGGAEEQDGLGEGFIAALEMEMGEPEDEKTEAEEKGKDSTPAEGNSDRRE